MIGTCSAEPARKAVTPVLELINSRCRVIPAVETVFQVETAESSKRTNTASETVQSFTSRRTVSRGVSQPEIFEPTRVQPNPCELHSNHTPNKNFIKSTPTSPPH